MLIAAPTLAEVYRGNRDFKFPSTENLITIAFDGIAAKILGHSMPEQILYTIKNENDLSHGYIKYDAMIVACAARWGAELIVHLVKRHMPKLAELVGLKHKTPDMLKSPLFR